MKPTDSMSQHTDEKDFKEIYPLHFATWHNNCEEIEELISNNEIQKESLDPRGRTPLMLAVTLCNIEATKFLLRHGCNAIAENIDGWTVVQEATASGNSELLSIVLENRDVQRLSSRLLGIPNLLSKLSEAPDFYVEMKWEFTSWVPLVSRMCPSDTYKVYKRGSNVRIDTTLLGFDQTQWQRGNRSYIFKGTSEGALMLEVDHDTKQVYQEVIGTVGSNTASYSGDLKPHASVVENRLRSPVVTSYIDTEKISFERDKQGIWGWRNDRSEAVNGHDCKVFSASNVELVTKSRIEHLSETDKKRAFSPASPIESFLNIAETEEKTTTNTDEMNFAIQNQEDTNSSIYNPCSIQPEDYFDASKELKEDIGRISETTAKIQKFKGHLWLAEEYPLKLQEQVLPIVDLMAISSMHFAKLKDFIQMQLPSGFPVKIEIPLFHVLTARITFGNIFGLDSPVSRVSTMDEDDRLTCIIEDSIFEAPSSYKIVGSHDGSINHRQMAFDEDDALLQYAIQQSIFDSRGSLTANNEEQIDIWEALQNSPNADSEISNHRVSLSTSKQTSPIHGPISTPEETQLQRAIEESLYLCMNTNSSCSEIEAPSPRTPGDDDIAMALSLSQKLQDEEQRRLKREEDIFNRILELSITEK